MSVEGAALCCKGTKTLCLDNGGTFSVLIELENREMRKVLRL